MKQTFVNKHISVESILKISKFLSYDVRNLSTLSRKDIKQEAFDWTK